MSLRSEVKRSKAASMALFSVLASTTRKFFCASGGWVTCCAASVSVLLPLFLLPCGAVDEAGTHADAREQHARHCVLCECELARAHWIYGGRTHLVANDGEELPVFVRGGRGCHVCSCVTAAAGHW